MWEVKEGSGAREGNPSLGHLQPPTPKATFSRDRSREETAEAKVTVKRGSPRWLLLFWLQSKFVKSGHSDFCL